MALETFSPPLERHRSCGLGLLAGALLVLVGCARDAVIESGDTNDAGYLLEPAASLDLGHESELLRAEVDLFGLSLASLESVRCPASTDRAMSNETRVTPAALVNAIRRTSGDARTEFVHSSAAPTRSDYHMRDGDLMRNYLVEHGDGRFDYSYDNGGAHTRRGHVQVPEGATAHDLHSAMVLMRAWRPRLGETAYFYVVLGRRLWRVDVTSRGPQVIKTNGGPQLTYRIDGVGVRLWQTSDVPPKRFSLWVSEAAERVPLRMVADASFGEVVMTLTEREVGVARCAADTGRAEDAAGARDAPAGVIGRSWRTPDLSRDPPSRE